MKGKSKKELGMKEDEKGVMSRRRKHISIKERVEKSLNENESKMELSIRKEKESIRDYERESLE